VTAVPTPTATAEPGFMGQPTIPPGTVTPEATFTLNPNVSFDQESALTSTATSSYFILQEGEATLTPWPTDLLVPSSTAVPDAQLTVTSNALQTVTSSSQLTTTPASPFTLTPISQLTITPISHLTITPISHITITPILPSLKLTPLH
jgi:hypothetical protein